MSAVAAPGNPRMRQIMRSSFAEMSQGGAAADAGHVRVDPGAARWTARMKAGRSPALPADES
jgi:hypothetical protein